MDEAGQGTAAPFVRTNIAQSMEFPDDVKNADPAPSDDDFAFSRRRSIAVAICGGAMHISRREGSLHSHSTAGLFPIQGAAPGPDCTAP